MGRLIFIAAPDDMTDWRDLAVDYIEELRERGELADIEVLSARGFDNAALNHAETYQEAILSPVRRGAALTIVLLGESVGLPLNDTFRFREDIAGKFRVAGIDWMKVLGVKQPELQVENVPLTGTLFEYFDTVLADGDRVEAEQCRIFFRGTRGSRSEPDFGNGKLLKEITARPNRLELLARYMEQIGWLKRFYGNWAGAPQRPLVFCKDDKAFLEALKSALEATFVADSAVIASPRRRRVDPRTITLPSLGPFDEARSNLFFGRQTQARDLFRQAVNGFTEGNRLTALLGPSGSGKSSLLRASLMPQMRTWSRRRQGWRSAFLSLSEKPSAQSPLLFLVEALAADTALPEIGPAPVLAQRLSGLSPAATGVRILEILRTTPATASRLLLVIDQFERALEGSIGRWSEEDAAAWSAFISVVSTLAGAPTSARPTHETGPQPAGSPVSYSVSVVVGLSDGEALVRAGLRVHSVVELPWLLDPTDVQHIVVDVFNALGLSIDPGITAAFRVEAERPDLQGPILPLLSVAIFSLHENWKARQRRGLLDGRDLTGGADTSASAYDVTLADFERCGCIRQALSWLGEAALRDAGGRYTDVADEAIEESHAPVHPGLSSAGALNFAFAALFRQLVDIVDDDQTLDRLRPVRLYAVEPALHPLVDALVKRRLLTKRTGDEVWLVHSSVLRDWPRAARWRQQEGVAGDIERRIRFDLARWRRDQADGYADADRRLWTNAREIEDAFALLALRGLGSDPTLADFVIAGSLRAAEHDDVLAGMALVIAAFFGRLDWAKALLHACPNAEAACNWISPDGDASALHNAAVRGDVDFVTLLLQHGAKPDLVAGGQTALHSAAAAGHAALCTLLLSKDMDRDRPDAGGRPALHLAAQNGELETCVVLLDAGANPRSTDRRGATALHRAVMIGNEDLCRVLVAPDSAAKAADVDGNTPLHIAAARGHAAICRLLLNHGADKEGRNRVGATPLDLAAATVHIDIVSDLLDDDASARTVDLTPLILGGAGEALIARLLGKHASANGSSRGVPPLIAAVLAGKTDLFWMLLSKGAQPSFTAPGHVTLAHALAERNDWTLLEALLARGVPIQLDEPRDDGRTPLDICRMVGADETIRVLFDEGVPDRELRPPNQIAVLSPAGAIAASPEGPDENQDDIPPQWIYVWFNIRGVMIVKCAGRFKEVPIEIAYDAKQRAICLDFENYVRREYYLIDENIMLRNFLLMPRERVLLQQEDASGNGALLERCFHVLQTDAEFLDYEALIQQRSKGFLLHGDEVPGMRLIAGASPDEDKRPRISMSLLAPVPPAPPAAGRPTNLASAVEANDLNLAREFVRLSTPDAIGRGSTTPVHVAATKGYLAMVDLLLSEEVALPFDVADGADQRPIDLAAAYGHQAVVDRLLQAGAAPPRIWRCPRVSDEANFLTFSAIDRSDPWLLTMLEGCGAQLIVPFETMQLRAAPLAFSDDTFILAIEDTARSGRREQFAIYQPNEDFVLLNWTNDPIYHFMSRHQCLLTNENVLEYARFFFHFVRGFLGRFLIKQVPEQIAWKPEATVQEIPDISEMVHPMVVGETGPDQFTLDASVIFRDALFSTRIGVARRFFESPPDDSTDVEDVSQAQVRRPRDLWLFDEHLHQENLPVEVDGPPGVFG